MAAKATPLGITVVATAKGIGFICRCKHLQQVNHNEAGEDYVMMRQEVMINEQKRIVQNWDDKRSS